MRVEADAGHVEEDAPGNLAHVDAPRRARASAWRSAAAGLSRNAERAGEPVAGPGRHDRQGGVAEREHAADLVHRAVAAPGADEVRAAARRHPAASMRACPGYSVSRTSASTPAPASTARASVRPARGPGPARRNRPAIGIDDDADAHGRRQPAMRRSMRGVTNHRRWPGTAQRQRVEVDPADRTLLELDGALGADQPGGELPQVGLVADARDVRSPRVLRQVGEKRRVGARRVRATG